MRTTFLGSKVRDRISGFEGEVIGEADYLYGPPQVLVAPSGLKDCAPIEALWFAVDRVEVLNKDNKVGFRRHTNETA